jgi:hypothetical protein
MAFLVEWRMTTGKTGQEWFPDHVLQSVMERVCKKFGNPERILGGPSIGAASSDGSKNTPKPRRKR